MTAYVVGFAFDSLHKVWLIKKTKPAWQAGKLNGVGGKIEIGETSVEAMSREFHEEAGVLISTDRWRMFHRETWSSGNTVDFYTTRLTTKERLKSMTEEKLVPLSWIVLSFAEFTLKNTLYNIPYLVPMAYTYLLEDPSNIPAHQPKEGNA